MPYADTILETFLSALSIVWVLGGIYMLLRGVDALVKMWRNR